MQITKRFYFEASHILPRHPGKCANLHGHSWQLTVGLEGAINPSSGFVLDYSDLSRIVDPLVNAMDHSHLNWIIRYPSSEMLASLIALHLHPLVGCFQEVSVSLAETRKCECAITVAASKGVPWLPEMSMPELSDAMDCAFVRPLDRDVITRQQLRWHAALEQSSGWISTLLRQEGQK